LSVSYLLALLVIENFIKKKLKIISTNDENSHQKILLKIFYFSKLNLVSIVKGNP